MTMPAETAFRNMRKRHQKLFMKDGSTRPEFRAKYTRVVCGHGFCCRSLESSLVPSVAWTDCPNSYRCSHAQKYGRVHQPQRNNSTSGACYSSVSDESFGAGSHGQSWTWTPPLGFANNMNTRSFSVADMIRYERPLRA